jgi:hypothetical protein
MDQSFDTVSVGFELLTSHGVELKLDYDGQFAPHAHSYSSGGYLRVETRF